MISELKKVSKIKEDADLTKYNTYRIHSKAKCIVFPSSLKELGEVLRIINKYKSKYFVIGNGSNIILPNYYDGIIIKLDKFNNVKIEKDYVYVECGYMINKLAMELVNMGYSALEWASGIPATIGGCVYNNAGAYNSDISNYLISALIFDGENVKEYSNEDLKFDYRSSLLKNNKSLIVLSCKLKIIKSNKKELKKLVIERTNKRIQTQDLSHPSCGSVFRNPSFSPAGKLIDDLGFKGYKINDAMVSNIHANFIINNGQATQEDIVALINIIKKEVKSNYNVDLVLEQEIIE